MPKEITRRQFIKDITKYVAAGTAAVTLSPPIVEAVQPLTRDVAQPFYNCTIVGANPCGEILLGNMGPCNLGREGVANLTPEDIESIRNSPYVRRRPPLDRDPRILY